MNALTLTFHPVGGPEPLPDYDEAVLTLDDKNVPMVCVRWKTDANGEHWRLHEYGEFGLDAEDAEWHGVMYFAKLPETMP
jgi:hypothetical protein